jgi:Phage portal protein, SPP1 Gp6-like
VPEQPEALSPEWWVARLYKRLIARLPEIDFYNAYYSGDHPLPWLAPQARDEFRRILRMTRSNYMGLVCDATAERLQVEGFRLGPDEQNADKETWRIWQANNLDSDFDMGILEALIGGQAYTLVAPNADDPGTPHIWVEHASQAIVEFEPGSGRRRRAAGLKVWDDDWTGEVHATLYLPDWIVKFKAQRPKSGAMPQNVEWSRREVAGEDWPAKNPLGVVPLIEMPNNPRLLTGGVSELADVTDVQDRINKTLADRLITQDYGAFPQKWASAWPDRDEDGNQNTIDIGRNRMVTTEVAETKFGQWDAAPLDPYSAAKREDVKDIASRTRTPAQYLLGEINNVNGETLKASESGLVSKVRQRMRPLSEAAEETMRLARRAAGLPDAGGAAMETLWRNPEFRTEAELTDAVVKRRQAGLSSLRQSREDIGYTEAQIQRMEADDAAERTDPLLEQVLRDSAGGVGAARSSAAALP